MAVPDSAGALPVIDVTPLMAAGPPARPAGVARQIEAACREHGFFYVTGHGVAPELPARLATASAAFFDLPMAAKMAIAMARPGSAWRGHFPVGAELTSGQPDEKEGLYFGAELAAADPRVRAGLPLHGANLFPRLTLVRSSFPGAAGQVSMPLAVGLLTWSLPSGAAARG